MTILNQPYAISVLYTASQSANIEVYLKIVVCTITTSSTTSLHNCKVIFCLSCAEQFNIISNDFIDSYVLFLLQPVLKSYSFKYILILVFFPFKAPFISNPYRMILNRFSLKLTCQIFVGLIIHKNTIFQYTSPSINTT